MRRRSDTSRPWSPEEVEVGMADVSEGMEDDVTALKALDEEVIKKKRDYKVEKSKLLLLAAAEHPELKSAELREAWVYLQVADLEMDYDIALNIAKARKEEINVKSKQGDLLRSAGKSHRQMTEYGHGRTFG